MKNKGFTLLEITVVISLIIFLSGIFFINYHGAEKQFALKRSANKIVQDIRRMQELNWSCKKTPADPFVSQEFPKGGYGIYFEAGLDYYVLFADCNGNRIYDKESGVAQGSSCANPVFNYTFPEEIEKIYLEKGIKVSDVLPDELSGLGCPEARGDCLNIVFFPPDPTLYVNNKSDIVDPPKITINFGGKSQKTIDVNKAGLIEIE